MTLNLSALEKAIEKSGKKKKHIADSLELSPEGLRNKLKGKTEFTRSEIEKLCEELNIVDLKEKEDIFFGQ